MIDDRFLTAAIIIMLVIILNDILKKHTKIDMDKIDVVEVYKKMIKKIKNYFNDGANKN